MVEKTQAVPPSSSPEQMTVPPSERYTLPLRIRAHRFAFLIPISLYLTGLGLIVTFLNPMNVMVALLIIYLLSTTGGIVAITNRLIKGYKKRAAAFWSQPFEIQKLGLRKLPITKQIWETMVALDVKRNTLEQFNKNQDVVAYCEGLEALRGNYLDLLKHTLKQSRPLAAKIQETLALIDTQLQESRPIAFAISQEAKRIGLSIDQLKKLQTILTFSKAIEVARLAKLLGLPEADLRAQITEWVAHYDIHLDGNQVIIKKDSVETLIEGLEKDFQKWTNKGKKVV